MTHFYEIHYCMNKVETQQLVALLPICSESWSGDVVNLTHRLFSSV